jgi:hypothetical protein
MRLGHRFAADDCHPITGRANQVQQGINDIVYTQQNPTVHWMRLGNRALRSYSTGTCSLVGEHLIRVK